MMCPNFFLIQEDFTFTKVMSCAPRERKMRRVGGVQVDQLQVYLSFSISPFSLSKKKNLIRALFKLKLQS